MAERGRHQDRVEVLGPAEAGFQRRGGRLDPWRTRARLLRRRVRRGDGRVEQVERELQQPLHGPRV